MSNNSDNPDDDADLFDSERLADAGQAKHFREAQKRGVESFTSFSEGMPAIDKFKILGATGEQQAIKRKGRKQNRAKKNASAGTARSVMRTPLDEDSFNSFTEGLPAANPLVIEGTEKETYIGVRNFVNATTCSFIADYADYFQNECAEQRAPDEFRSRTLDRLMFLLKRLPWNDRLRFEVSMKPDFEEYCFDEETIVLNKQFDDEETVIAFTHQAYHATNRLLTKLYDEDEMLDLETFIDIYMWAEVAALITEMNVRRELGLWKVAPPKVLCQESDGSLFSITVEDTLKTRGMKALHDALYYSRLRGNEKAKLVDVYMNLFQVYKDNFERDNQLAQSLIRNCLDAGLDRDCI